MNAPLETLSQIYPKHVWIDLSSAELSLVKLPQNERDRQEAMLAQVDLNRICMTAIKDWIRSTVSLELQPIFPCWLGGKDTLALISKLVNGFALQIGQTKVVFIPNTAIDLTEFEVPQEWVDLPHWAADYYVPIRVDLEREQLHLWGFIGYDELKIQAQFDRVFRNYHLIGTETIADLELLITACELQSSDAATVRLDLGAIAELSASALEKTLQQLQQHRGRLSPRLELPFSQWGALLDRSHSLERYLNPETDLGSWWQDPQSAICDGWETLVNFFNPPQAIPALSATTQLPPLNLVRGVSLGSASEIAAAIATLYQHQTDVPLPATPSGIADLVPLLQYCHNERIWWQAAEYLWTLQPDLPPSIARIRKLDTQFAGSEIALTIATIPTPDRRIAVLVRLCPVARGNHLPPGLQLILRDECGVNFLTTSQGDPYVATARETIQDSCIQLYFVADARDRFVAWITLNDTEVTKAFKLPQLPLV